MKTALNGIIRSSVVAALIVVATAAYAGDDTARFYGTWKTTVSANGQTVTIISIHDANGYRNFVRTPTGDIAAGDGTFSAANGQWSSNAAPPNNGGVYHFVGNDTVIATNTAGQTVTWIRDKSAPPPPAAAPSPGNGRTPVDGNAAAKSEGYVAPSGRPGTTVAQQPAATSSGTSRPPTPSASADDASLSPNVKAGFAALKSGDRVTAWRDFMSDAQKGNSGAEAAVGSMLFQNINPPGTGFYKDCEKWLLSSAKQGNQHGMDMLAQYYFMEGRNVAGGINPGVNNTPIPPQLQQQADARFTLARQWFEKSAARGDDYAMGNLAIMLDAGVGGPADHARAAALREVVKAGPDTNFARRVTADPAMQSINASWQSGHYADALKYAQTLADKGDANAEALLGKAYYEGVGEPRSFPMALKWLDKAVAQDNADAMFILGLMNEHGDGMIQNVTKAQDLFDRAAAKGQRYAALEAQALRVGAEVQRIAAKQHGGGAFDIACETAGGIPAPGECMKGGGDIDPFNAEQAAGSGYEPAPEPEP
jgi:TPR repeat protein